MLMGMLFRNSDLEIRFNAEPERADRRQGAEGLFAEGGAARLPGPSADVLRRRSQHRIEKIDHRLEVLEGFITPS
jgi:topoisomerase IV subunit A